MQKRTLLPEGFTIRPSSLDDLQAITELTRICEIELNGVAETTLDDIRGYWQVPGFQAETDSWVVFSPEGQMVAAASMDQMKHVRIFADADVHPDYRGLGIGSHLLELAEEWGMRQIPLAAPDMRVALTCSKSAKNLTAHRLLEDFGFRVVRQFWRMAIEMKEVPLVPTWPDGITVHTFVPEMAHAVYEADEEAFQDHYGHIPATFEMWEHWTLKRSSFDPALWFLAMDGDEIAGFALCRDQEEQGGHVGVLGVRRPWRRRGLGLALLYHAFGEFYRRGITTVTLGVDAESLTGATRLYERAGMHVTRHFYRYEKELRAGRELSTQVLPV